MRKREAEALRRLEEALLEPETPPQAQQDPLEHTWHQISDTAYRAYNTDSTDVDMEAYSQDVSRGRRSSMLPLLITILALVTLAAMVLWFLKYLGVM